MKRELGKQRGEGWGGTHRIRAAFAKKALSKLNKLFLGKIYFKTSPDPGKQEVR